MLWQKSAHDALFGTEHSPIFPGETCHVLVVSADRVVVDLVRGALAAAGYMLHVFAGSDSAGVRVFAQRVDAVIIDLTCAASPGSRDDLARIVQLAGCPCLALSGRGRLDQRMMALQAGAAAVLSRPLQATELVARLGALVATNRIDRRISAVFLSPCVAVDADGSIIACHDCLISLTAQESVLLRHLAQNVNHIVGYAFLCDILDLPPDAAGLMALRQLIVRLRRKLCDDPARSLHLHTVRYLGYGLHVREDAAVGGAQLAPAQQVEKAGYQAVPL